MSTVFVRTTRDVRGYFTGPSQTPTVELLANYGKDYMGIVETCKCCACCPGLRKGCTRE